MSLAPDDLVACRIESLSHDGRGVTRVEGLVVFVTGGVPESEVQIRLTAVKKSFAEAVVAETLVASPHAVEPFCPHFGLCGGCRMQHIAYPKQVEWKAAAALETVRRIGGAEPALVLPPVASPQEREYRNKMEFAFAGPGRSLHLGLHELDSPARVVDIGVCHLQPPACTRLMLETRGYCRHTGIDAFHGRTERGFWRHLVVRSSQRGEILVHCITSPDKKYFAAAKALGEHLMALDSPPTAFLHSTRSGPKAVAYGQRRILHLGGEDIEERLGDLRFRLSANAFFQTNTLGAARLYDLVKELCDLGGRDVVYDLYSGAGGIALWLAGQAREVLGFELAREAVADAQANAALNALDNAHFTAVDLEREAEPFADLPQADVLVCDPPREGLDAGGLRAILAARPARVVYVSCNPATLARDLKLLTPTYTPAVFGCVDMFPHAPHVECVLRLDRADAGNKLRLG